MDVLSGHFLASLVSGEEEESVQHDVGTGWEG